MDTEADDARAPEIPEGPPWPPDFVADLHAGCYDNDGPVCPSCDPMIEVWAAVRADPAAARMLADLDDVRAVLGRFGDYQ